MTLELKYKILPATFYEHVLDNPEHISDASDEFSKYMFANYYGHSKFPNLYFQCESMQYFYLNSVPYHEWATEYIYISIRYGDVLEKISSEIILKISQFIKLNLDTFFCKSFLDKYDQKIESMCENIVWYSLHNDIDLLWEIKNEHTIVWSEHILREKYIHGYSFTKNNKLTSNDYRLILAELRYEQNLEKLRQVLDTVCDWSINTNLEKWYISLERFLQTYPEFVAKNDIIIKICYRVEKNDKFPFIDAMIELKNKYKANIYMRPDDIMKIIVIGNSDIVEYCTYNGLIKM